MCYSICDCFLHHVRWYRPCHVLTVCIAENQSTHLVADVEAPNSVHIRAIYAKQGTIYSK